MSLLRVCAFASRLRGTVGDCAVRAGTAGRCELCVRAKSRFPGSSLHLQRRTLSTVIPKSEDVKKRVLEQWQLLDVLEARIQQLQTDVASDVQHAKVHFVKVPPLGRAFSSGGTHKGSPQEKPDVPKPGQTSSKGTKKSEFSRWKEKLSQEKKNKLKKQQHLQQKMQTSVKDKQSAKSKASTMATGTTHKTISSKAKQSRERLKLSEEIQAAVSSTTASIKASKKKQKDPKNTVPDRDGKGGSGEYVRVRDEQLAEAEALDGKLGGQASQRSAAERLKPDAEGAACGDIQLSIRSYLEACIFIGDVERAQRFLLSQHRVRSRRKLLNTGVYNIMMRVWAKKGMLNQIGRIFILLEEAGLKPNLGSYSAALECMGRNPNCSPKAISRCLNQMEEDGLTLDDLFSDCVFRRDEKDMMLQAIRAVEPGYEPRPHLLTDECPSPLVHHFYTQVVCVCFCIFVCPQACCNPYSCPYGWIWAVCGWKMVEDGQTRS